MIVLTPLCARRAHVVDAVRLRDGVFQRRRDEPGDDIGVGAVIGRRHGDDGILGARILQNRQRADRAQAERENHQADDGCENRPANEDVGEVHGARASNSSPSQSRIRIVGRLHLVVDHDGRAVVKLDSGPRSRRCRRP